MIDTSIDLNTIEEELKLDWERLAPQFEEKFIKENRTKKIESIFKKKSIEIGRMGFSDEDWLKRATLYAELKKSYDKIMEIVNSKEQELKPIAEETTPNTAQILKGSNSQPPQILNVKG